MRAGRKSILFAGLLAVCVVGFGDSRLLFAARIGMGMGMGMGMGVGVFGNRT